jgi:ferrous iron transport protein B
MRRQAHPNRTPTVLIVGNPNVGKSVLFHKLTGRYVTVSNYPGTTVEVARGTMRYREREFTIIDSPGMYSLTPITDEERVARRILLRDRPDLVLHVVDAKNLARMLPLTVQLLETGAPVILVLNMMDELERAGTKHPSRPFAGAVRRARRADGLPHWARHRRAEGVNL